MVKALLNVYDADTMESIRLQAISQYPEESPEALQSTINHQLSTLLEAATAPFNSWELRNYIIDVCKKYDQLIDTINLDEIVSMGWVKDTTEAAASLVQNFAEWIEKHRNEITALQIWYSQPYSRRTLTLAMVKQLLERLTHTEPRLQPMAVWQAYEQIETVSGKPRNNLTALVALVRRAIGKDGTLTAWDKTVDKNFQECIFTKQHGAIKYTGEQVQWLRMIKDCIAASFHIDKDDFELWPFNKQGGLGTMWRLFGEETDAIINEMNESLIA